MKACRSRGWGTIRLLDSQPHLKFSWKELLFLLSFPQLPVTWQACVQTVEHIVNTHICRACLSIALIREDSLWLPSTFLVLHRGISMAEPKSHPESYLQRSLRNVAFSLPAPAMCMVVVGSGVKGTDGKEKNGCCVQTAHNMVV